MCELSSWWPTRKRLVLGTPTAFIEIVGNSPPAIESVHESVAQGQLTFRLNRETVNLEGSAQAIYISRESRTGMLLSPRGCVHVSPLAPSGARRRSNLPRVLLYMDR